MQFIIRNNHLVMVIDEHAKYLEFISKKFIPGKEGQGEVTLYDMKKKNLMASCHQKGEMCLPHRSWAKVPPSPPLSTQHNSGVY